jgi:glycine/D-amino acid oxidase-like deaminating enzyme
MDVVVVGAGVMGCAIASELASRGATVTVIEAGRPGRATSAATFAWTNSNENEPPAYHELRTSAMELLRSYSLETKDREWYHGGGSVEWATDDASHDRLQKVVARRQELDYPVDWISPEDLSELEPDLAREQLPERIAHFSSEGWVSTQVLIGVLLGKIRDHGVRVLTGTAVTHLETVGNRVTEIVAGGHRLEVDAVVNCAGAEADTIAAHAGVELPLMKQPGLIVCTGPVATSLARIVRTPGLNIRPDGGGRVVVAGPDVDSALDGDGTEINRERVDAALASAASVLPVLFDAEIESTRVGVRPIPPDRLPILGPTGEAENLFHAVTHGGVTLCLGVARLISGMVTSGDEPDEMELYRLDRQGRFDPLPASA